MLQLLQAHDTGCMCVPATVVKLHILYGHALQAFELTTRLDALRDRDEANAKELDTLRQENDSLRHENQQLAATLKAVRHPL